MLNHVDAWLPAARELGVDIIGPLTITLDDKQKVDFDVLFEKFGAPKGTLVTDNFEKVRAHVGTLKSMGYTVSTFSAPQSCRCYPTSDLIELLKDWTWCGPDSERPTWISARE